MERDMQREDSHAVLIRACTIKMDWQHVQRHAAWTCKCYMDMNMHHRHEHGQAASTCPCYVSKSMQHVHVHAPHVYVDAACPCPCFLSMPMLYRPCPCCMSMSMSNCGQVVGIVEVLLTTAWWRDCLVLESSTTSIFC
jgi:hypothetical protein